MKKKELTFKRVESEWKDAPTYVVKRGRRIIGEIFFFDNSEEPTFLWTDYTGFNEGFILT